METTSASDAGGVAARGAVRGAAVVGVTAVDPAAVVAGAGVAAGCSGFGSGAGAVAAGAGALVVALAVVAGGGVSEGVVTATVAIGLVTAMVVAGKLKPGSVGSVWPAALPVRCEAQNPTIANETPTVQRSAMRLSRWPVQPRTRPSTSATSVAVRP